MNPLVLAIAGLGGYLVYEKVSHESNGSNPHQPDPNQKQPFWSSWFNQGSQPQTGNGAPTTDVSAVANAVTATEKFATSVAAYFGTSEQSGAGAHFDTGAGVGANSNQVQSYSDGSDQWGMWTPSIVEAGDK